jgi:hypothetical protein
MRPTPGIAMTEAFPALAAKYRFAASHISSPALA